MDGLVFFSELQENFLFFLLFCYNITLLTIAVDDYVIGDGSGYVQLTNYVLIIQLLAT